MSNKLNNNTTSKSSNSNTQSIAGIKNISKSPNALPNNKINTPTLNNKITKSTEIPSNTPSTKSSTSQSKDFQTAKEEIGVYEVVTTNYLLLIGFLISFNAEARQKGVNLVYGFPDPLRTVPIGLTHISSNTRDLMLFVSHNLIIFVSRSLLYLV